MNDLNNSRFCSNENTPSPFVVIENGRPSELPWVHTYPSQGPILHKVYFKVLADNSNAYRNLGKCLLYFIGIDLDKGKIKKWSTNLQSIINRCFELNDGQRSQAHQLLQRYEKTRNIEHLLMLYTLDSSICRILVQGEKETQSLHEPILDNLGSVLGRAFQGTCYRGLIMKHEDFQPYLTALKAKEAYVCVNTFCSATIDPAVADCFTGHVDNRLSVIMVIDFVQSCRTAICLFASPSESSCISQFPDEQEVLILPETVFIIKKSNKIMKRNNKLSTWNISIPTTKQGIWHTIDYIISSTLLSSINIDVIRI